MSDGRADWESAPQSKPSSGALSKPASPCCTASNTQISLIAYGAPFVSSSKRSSIGSNVYARRSARASAREKTHTSLCSPFACAQKSVRPAPVAPALTYRFKHVQNTPDFFSAPYAGAASMRTFAVSISSARRATCAFRSAEGTPMGGGGGGTKGVVRGDAAGTRCVERVKPRAKAGARGADGSAGGGPGAGYGVTGTSRRRGAPCRARWSVGGGSVDIRWTGR